MSPANPTRDDASSAQPTTSAAPPANPTPLPISGDSQPLSAQPPRISTAPIRKHHFKTPLLRLQLHDLNDKGATIFLSNIKAPEDLETQVQNVLNLLYASPTPTPTHMPGTRSVTLILRSMDGLAYTTGTELDSDHKEIHINFNWLRTLDSKPSAEIRHEVLGVLCHELVHCFQWAAQGTCPGGLIEGVADWVRLRAGLPARHWKRSGDGSWDQGYQTTGYFLDWLEKRCGEGTVRRLNQGLRQGKYDELKLFKECCGDEVEKLWAKYGESLKKDEGEVEHGDGNSAVDEKRDEHEQKMKNVASQGDHIALRPRTSGQVAEQ